MKAMVRTPLLLAANTALGVGILVLSQGVKLPAGLPSPLLPLALFFALNLAYVRLFRLSAERKSYWSATGIGYLFPGCLAGMLIAAVPLALAGITGTAGFAAIRPVVRGLAGTSVLLTLVITGWEELWFRSLMLNQCRRYLPPVAIAVINGLLFLLVHALNPAIHLLQEGPELFFAGALLTLLYFRWQTIWLPAGVHWGNNLLASKLAALSGAAFSGHDATIRAAVLAVLFFFFVLKSPRQNHERKSPRPYRST